MREGSAVPLWKTARPADDSDTDASKPLNLKHNARLRDRLWRLYQIGPAPAQRSNGLFDAPLFDF